MERDPRARWPTSANSALDEDALAAVFAGVADDQIQVAVAVDVAELGVGGRVRGRRKVPAGALLELAAAVVAEIAVGAAVEAVSGDEEAGVGEVDVEVAVFVEVDGGEAGVGLVRQRGHAEVGRVEEAVAVVEVEGHRLGPAVADDEV